jgi:hypothetical protein
MVLINNNFVRGQNPPALYEKKKRRRNKQEALRIKCCAKK